MISRGKNVVRSVVPLLIFALLPLYMLASLMTSNTTAQNTPSSALPMVGRLEVHGGRHIKVDGNDAESGFTILDGQTLETSDCTSATVHMLPVMLSGAANEIGTVELAVNTKTVIYYSAGKVNLNLAKGCTRVQMATEIEATIALPDGSVTPAIQAATPNRNRAEVCFPVGEKRDYRPSCIAPIVWWGATGGAAVIATTFAIVGPCSRGEETSPDRPANSCR